MGNLARFTIVIFWILIVDFFIILCQLFLPIFGFLLAGSIVFFIPMTIFCLLGLILLILISGKKEKNELKKFLILTGASAVGFFVFVILHNAFYALNTTTGNSFILNYLVEGLQVISFLIAVFVCPISFIVGVIGSIILLIKEGSDKIE